MSNTIGTGEAGASSADGGVSRRFAEDDDLASMEEARRLQRQFDGEAEGYRAPDAAYQECLISDEPGPEDMYSGASAGVAALLFGSSAAAPTGTESSARGAESAIQSVLRLLVDARLLARYQLSNGPWPGCGDIQQQLTLLDFLSCLAFFSGG